VRIVALDAETEQALLAQSIEGLYRLRPDQSSLVLFGRRGRLAAGLGFVLFVVLLVAFPVDTAIGVGGIMTAVYAAVIINRVVLFRASFRDNALDRISDEEALAIPDTELPPYTVLIPAYREPEVIRLLLSAVGSIEYPANKLDVKVLLEADDEETISAAQRVDLGPQVEIVLVPPAQPRTKPKALNYGLQLARGEIVTIYDAEDIPDPLQLRRAVVAFRRHGPRLACVQARLLYSNVNQNIITRWFTLEYAMWFTLLLPGLVDLGAPVPLGGTSNHFRRDVLDQLGGWDPHNVTEDADLGVRLYRQGFEVRILDSVTFEEANSDFVNWVKQRSRWYKGYLQTWLVHMRHPGRTYREMGLKGFTQFNLFVGGTPVLALLNVLLWTMTGLWFVGHPGFIKAIFPAPVYYLGLACWSVGNFLIVYLTVATVRVMDEPTLLLAACLVPIYWVMMAIASAKAFVQLVFTPSYWEKTTHGLSHPPGGPTSAS
jgi:glycosyltransferase XagB